MSTGGLAQPEWSPCKYINTYTLRLLLTVTLSPCDGVQIGAEAVVKVGVGLPNLLKHLDIQRELK